MIEPIAAIVIEDGGVIVCYSRCLWCGRRTPHEVCHEHGSDTFMQSLSEHVDTDDLWEKHFGDEAEICTDFTCSLWDGNAPRALSPMTRDEYQAVESWRLASVGQA